VLPLTILDERSHALGGGGGGGGRGGGGGEGGGRIGSGLLRGLVLRLAKSKRNRPFARWCIDGKTTYRSVNIANVDSGVNPIRSAVAGLAMGRPASRPAI